ncbi:MAG TPA: TRAP transporter TatT component family protein [Kofleriaceae bacterium]|nr:TRAP transporter TatT component family protein [Kofleriaceae bacterium]
MRLVLMLVLAASTAASSACDIGKLTVGTTAKVLLRAQPSLQQESDYELARQAIPGALKTVEGFWIVDPENENLIQILTEGYCQYGTGFAEDDWEAARLVKDRAAVEYHNERATKIFNRCLNYALLSLGKEWQRDLFGDEATVTKLLRDHGGRGKRFAMMYAGVALGSLVNHNLSQMEMLGYLPTVEMVLNHVVELDRQKPPANLAHAALPYIALGMIHTGRPVAMGGQPDRARGYFEQALRVSGGKFLLARTLMGYRVGLAKNDRKFFHDQLKQVLETAPSVWPEQRLANEVAHRKARRYLSKEKELFP